MEMCDSRKLNLNVIYQRFVYVRDHDHLAFDFIEEHLVTNSISAQIDRFKKLISCPIFEFSCVQ